MTALRVRTPTGPTTPSFANLPTGFVCQGCGEPWPAAAPAPMRCPRADDDGIDHVVVRTLDPTRVRFPRSADRNPFVRYRTLFHAYHVARALGWADREYVGFVERLDAAVAQVDGGGFRATPLVDAPALAEQLGLGPGRGGVLVKDETGNVSGSHKARHLFGTLLELGVGAELSRTIEPEGAASRAPVPEHARFAIASCGNAALAAAVVARAADRDLDVFIPVDADPAVVARLEALGAHIAVCERAPGSPGDPTYARLRRAIDRGAVAFTCQGNENGLAIEGGETLGWELATDLAARGARLDRLFVQVGGGALASSLIQGLDEARALGAIGDLPRIHAVQTRGAWPLARAYELVARRLAARLDRLPLPARIRVVEPTAPPAAEERADRLRAFVTTPAGSAELARVARHRSSFMWPWESEPHSLAHGILDDETYDWFAVVRGMLATGGYPVVVDEATVAEANELGRETTGIDADATGTAGLAGLLAARRAGVVGDHETVAVLFTGITRRVASAGDIASTEPAHGGRT